MCLRTYRMISIVIARNPVLIMSLERVNRLPVNVTVCISRKQARPRTTTVYKSKQLCYLASDIYPLAMHDCSYHEKHQNHIS